MLEAEGPGFLRRDPGNVTSERDEARWAARRGNRSGRVRQEIQAPSYDKFRFHSGEVWIGQWSLNLQGEEDLTQQFEMSSIHERAASAWNKDLPPPPYLLAFSSQSLYALKRLSRPLPSISKCTFKSVCSFDHIVLLHPILSFPPEFATRLVIAVKTRSS